MLRFMRSIFVFVLFALAIGAIVVEAHSIRNTGYFCEPYSCYPIDGCSILSTADSTKKTETEFCNVFRGAVKDISVFRLPKNINKQISIPNILSVFFSDNVGVHGDTGFRPQRSRKFFSFLESKINLVWIAAIDQGSSNRARFKFKPTDGWEKGHLFSIGVAPVFQHRTYFPQVWDNSVFGQANNFKLVNRDEGSLYSDECSVCILSRFFHGTTLPEDSNGSQNDKNQSGRFSKIIASLAALLLFAISSILLRYAVKTAPYFGGYSVFFVIVAWPIMFWAIIILADCIWTVT